MHDMRTHYTPLPQDDAPAEKPLAIPAKSSVVMRWSIIVILLCTTIDILLVFSVLFYGSHDIFFFGRADLASPLEMPSTYISFDLLYDGTVQRNYSHSPIVNIPRSTSQVSSLKPSEVFLPSPKSRLTVYESDPRNNRRLWVSSNTSTIVQFRVMDYGMEKCSLALSVPAAGEADVVVSQLK
ncbi:hypothetical protein BV25DRAFT_1974612 [Artomyces pyxidatus]|uniref:Uncharacterized protein n=1 Tax=Artomyces pyxidatus TaxID=48021 RepID=A0ACB8SL14_9AGAM|nr:hypothetical protein BV25DRAFT_1974612 [Artomyces pyxidatus]